MTDTKLGTKYNLKKIKQVPQIHIGIKTFKALITADVTAVLLHKSRLNHKVSERGTNGVQIIP